MFLLWKKAIALQSFDTEIDKSNACEQKNYSAYALPA